MKRKISILVLLAFLSLSFAEDGPIKSAGWNWKDGCKLNGKVFYDVAASYREQEGYAFIEGYGKLQYWLYDTYSYHNGDAKDIMEKYLPYWLEKKGYVIDYNKTEKYSPNNGLANSVKELMSLHNSDVSVVLFENSNPHITVNNYDKDQKYYFTYVYYIKKTGSHNNNQTYSAQNNNDEKYYHYRYSNYDNTKGYEITIENYISIKYCKKNDMPKEDAIQISKEAAEEFFKDASKVRAIQKDTDIIYENGDCYRIWLDWYPNGSYGTVTVLMENIDDEVLSWETIYMSNNYYDYNQSYEAYKNKVNEYLNKLK